MLRSCGAETPPWAGAELKGQASTLGHWASEEARQAWRPARLWPAAVFNRCPCAYLALGAPPPCSLLSLLQVIQQNYDERADMWSAGIMMYQLLSGALTGRC